jgi:urease gamma subunit
LTWIDLNAQGQTIFYKEHVMKGLAQMVPTLTTTLLALRVLG